MRFLATVMAGTIFASGCASQSYRIPGDELTRLAAMAPEQRAQRVMVSQELTATQVNNTEPVRADTEIIWVPRITIYGGHTHDRHRETYGTGGSGGGGGRWGSGPQSSGGGKSGGGGKGLNLGSGGGDGKAAAIAIIVIAVVALVAVAGVEASRYDGWVELHPMHPVHLIGKDGSQAVMPLAWIDPQAASWTEKAIVRPTDGPWRELGRRSLMRSGTYGVYGGSGSSTSVTGQTEFGPSFVIQGGYFPRNDIGIVANVAFAWRDNEFGGTLFDSRYSLELQVLPLKAGPLHAGGYGSAGLAYRWEDVPGTTLMGTDGNGNSGSGAFAGGGMLQLELHSRIALTARAGIVATHGDRQTDLLFGLSVY
jgi:hypothetical protein